MIQPIRVGLSTDFPVQFARSQDDVLASLLLECFHAWVRLAEQLQSADELGHVSGMFRFHSNADDRRGLEYGVNTGELQRTVQYSRSELHQPC